MNQLLKPRMLYVLTLVAAIALVGGPQLFGQQNADDGDVIKQLKIKGLGAGFREGRFREKPQEIKSSDDLEKAFPNEVVRKQVAAAVDFKTQTLLLFKWSGSGQDQLTFKVEKANSGKSVVFQYKAGLTRDLRGHAYLYAIKTGVTYKTEKGR